MSRAFDHVVLPVADLAIARARYEALGFTVAPDGIHPFGTANCCIFFQSGGFLEPLTLADEALCDDVLADGRNSAFVRDHRDFTADNPGDGFSHLVLKSPDADGDFKAFSKHRILAGTTSFERMAHNSAGDAQKVAFDLTFARDLQSPHAKFFTCHALLPLEISFEALRAHQNGVKGVTRIVSVAACPDDHAEFARQFTGSEPSSSDDGLICDLAGVEWVIEPYDALAKELGSALEMPSQEDRGMRHCAIVFSFREHVALQRLLAVNGIDARQIGEKLVVPPGPGQGFWAIFEPGG